MQIGVVPWSAFLFTVRGEKVKTMKKCNIGGQAVIEGVMMRAPSRMAIAVRRSDGEIVVTPGNSVPLRIDTPY